MDKSKIKKMAVMGMASGMMLAAQAPVEAAQETNTQLSASCGARSSCSNRSQCGGRASCYSRSSCASCGARNARRDNSRNFTADAADDIEEQRAASQRPGKLLTENELLQQLNPEGKAIFRGLDTEGKALALRYASEGTFRDKNEAVKAAAQKGAEKRARMMNR